MLNKSGAIIIEGHVQGLSNTRSLGAAGIPVYIVDKVDCIARYSRYCKKFFKCPEFNLDEFADFLIRLAIAEKIEGWILIPSNDHAVYTISKHKDKLSRFYKITTPDFDIIEIIYDKLRFLQIAEDINIPLPITQTFSAISDIESREIPFPVLTKGRHGLSFYKRMGKKAFLANSEIELVKVLSLISSKYSLSGCFTQELIPINENNKTISFTAYCENGLVKTYWMGEKIREHPIQFGTATYARSVYINECYIYSVKLLSAIKYTGVCEIEYLKDPRDGLYKLIEMNARTWLWVGLAKACGIDYAKILYDSVNKVKIDYPTSYKTDIYWINPITDFLFSFLSIFKGKLSLKYYLRSCFKFRNVNALFIKKDLMPGCIYLLFIIKMFKNR